MKFTDRRLSEATTLLSSEGSTIGYDLLVAEAKQTQVYIARKSDIQTGDQFNKNIDAYKLEIEKKKVEVRAQIAANSGDPNTPVPTTPPVAEAVSVRIPQTSTIQTSGQIIVVNKPEAVVIHKENPVEVLQKLEETEVKLDVIQKEVIKETHKNRSAKEKGKGKEKEADKTAVPTPTPITSAPVPTDLPNAGTPGF